MTMFKQIVAVMLGDVGMTLGTLILIMLPLYLWRRWRARKLRAEPLKMFVYECGACGLRMIARTIEVPLAGSLSPPLEPSKPRIELDRQA
jgi:hypothetical protein